MYDTFSYKVIHHKNIKNTRKEWGIHFKNKGLFLCTFICTSTGPKQQPHYIVFIFEWKYTIYAFYIAVNIQNAHRYICK